MVRRLGAYSDFRMKTNYMAETQDDSICQLLKQIRALNETLDSDQAFQSDQLRALRLLRLTLMSVVSNSASQLKQIADAVQQINTKWDSELAIFSDKGQLRSYGQSLEYLLEPKPSESFFSNSSKKGKFLDESQKAFSAANLPWKRELSDEEHYEPRMVFHSEKNKDDKWLSCLLTKLSSLDGAETGRAACFQDLTQLVKLEQRLAGACRAFAGETIEIDTANLEIEQIRARLKRGPEKLEIDQFAPRTSERPPADSYADNGQAKKVLVVDDIAINQKLLAKRLQKLNLESEFASNGKQGLEMALAGNYGLIFMDCEMPVMDGFEATQLIRKAEIGTGRHVPIIALTSYDREDDRERCLSSGMDEYLSKGASPNLLQEVVEWCLRRSRGKEGEDLNIADYEEDLDLPGLNESFSKEELNEIFDLFLPSTNTLMRCLRMSMDERDIRSVGHFAYSLKGPFASLGMLKTSKLTASTLR